MNDDELSALIGQHASRHKASSQLRGLIRAQVAVEAAAGHAAPLKARWPLRAWVEARRWLTWCLRWRQGGVGFAIGVACTVSLFLLAPQLGTDRAVPLDAELVSAHVRALQTDQLFQVASSDQHTVKPWFQGKLDYAPPVFNLADEGYPLLGGRVTHMQEQAVATLIYTHRKHVLTVFVRPSGAPKAPVRTQYRGFTVSRWADESMQYEVVSDMNPTEVAHFGELWRAWRAKG